MVALLLSLTLGIPEPAQFQPYHSESGVTITRAPTEPHPWIQGRGHVESPLESLTQRLTDFATYPQLFDGMIRRATLVRAAPTLWRVHLVWAFPFFMRDRDAVLTYALEQKPGQAFLRWHRSDEPGDPAYGVRIESVAGETHLVAKGAGTEVTYTYLGDLGADLSEGTREAAWKKEPVKYFEALRSSPK